MEQLGTHLRIEEGIRVQDGIKDTGVKDKCVHTSSINIVGEGQSSWTKRTNKRPYKFNNNKPPYNKKAKKGKPGTCWECGGPYFKKDCPSWKRKKANQQYQQNVGQNQGIVPHDATNLEMNFVAVISEINVVQDDDSWWVDSRASRHVCKDRQFFKTFQELKDGPILYMGNDSTVRAKGMGHVQLLLTSGNKLTLTDVVYVPEVRKNLISGGLLNKYGFKMVFEADKFVLSKGGVYVGQGYYCNGMFKLSVDNKITNSVYVINISSLWHNRLCHVNYRRLYDMSKLGLIPSFDINIDKCKTCMLNKITRNPFHTVERQSVLLELVHSDLCDFHSTPSFGNKKYIVTFIDDFS